MRGSRAFSVPSAAQSLQCYVCKQPIDISQCRTPVTCPPRATVCTTTLHSVDLGYPFFGNITVTRDCEEECLTSDGIGAQKPKSCCYTDLCTEDTNSSSRLLPELRLQLELPDFPFQMF
uniref:Snake toxin/toxin-like domain-containing protein n=1 Tax=Zonotrichia albicollis TaxID=44394 RepID=A0A8D2NA16_ZONAL